MWRFIVTDLSHTPVGELLNASDRTVLKVLSRLDTLTFRVDSSNRLADRLLSCEAYIKGYRNGQIEYHGPVITAEDNVDRERHSIAINSVSVGWELAKRLAGKSSTGQQFTSATDRALISKALIDAANTESETGISTAALPISASSAITYTAGPYRPISEIIAELSASTDGYDWRIEPLDNFASGAVTGPKIGAFTAAPIIGSVKANAIFEFGTGRKNIATYQHTVSRDTQANRIWSFGSGGASDTANPPVSNDASTAVTASLAKWGLIEDIAQSDLTVAALRKTLINEHAAIRNKPRQLIKFVPRIGSGVEYATDYRVGDIVRARAVRDGTIRFDAQFRVWAVQFEVQPDGSEKLTLTLADES